MNTADQLELKHTRDRIAIQNVLAIYCRGIDRLDEHLIASAYWPEAKEDHGVFKGTAENFAPWIVKFLDENYRATAHRLGQSYVEVSGKLARAETYFSSLHQLSRGDGSIFEAVDGRYLDEFSERDGVWKISSRLVVLDFMREFDSVVAQVASTPGVTFGKRTADDPSYPLFAQYHI